ncbi:MAG: hypothetical protein AB1631_29570 [Acidobacteriota bacterium]
MSLPSAKNLTPSFYLLYLSATQTSLDQASLNSLIVLAERAYSARELGVLERAVAALRSRSSAHAAYYHALLQLRQPPERRRLALPLIQSVIESPFPPLRARGHAAMAAYQFINGDFDEAARESEKVLAVEDRDGWASLTALRMKSIVEAVQGNHFNSLAMLDSILPLAVIVGRSDPASLHAYLNSLAFELIETGQIEEANKVAAHISKSPLLGKYDEWQETLEDERLKSRRSRIVIPFPSVSEDEEAERMKCQIEIAKLMSKPEQPLGTLRQAAGTLRNGLEKKGDL